MAFIKVSSNNITYQTYMYTNVLFDKIVYFMGQYNAPNNRHIDEWPTINILVDLFSFDVIETLKIKDNLVHG